MNQTHQQQLFKWLVDDKQRMLALKTLEVVAERYYLEDVWIAAGFVRNLVWNKLHSVDSHALNDIDVIHFNANKDEAFDREIEDKLGEISPSLPWSVKNQARMHLKNGDEQYSSSIDAMSFWPEIETAVAVRLRKGEFVLAAPFGLSSLFALELTHNSKRSKALFHKRIDDKSWLKHYPKLNVII